jgi:hypothetical protein
MIDPLRIMEVAHANPGTCEEFWWGREVRCTDMRRASVKLGRQLLCEAWQRKTLKPEKYSKKKRS